MCLAIPVRVVEVQLDPDGKLTPASSKQLEWLPSTDAIKNLSFELKNQVDNLFFLAGAEIDGKPMLSLILSDNLVKEKNLNATNIIRELAKEIQGGGGGQPFYATAGGKNSAGLEVAIRRAESFLT